MSTATLEETTTPTAEELAELEATKTAEKEEAEAIADFESGFVDSSTELPTDKVVTPVEKVDEPAKADAVEKVVEPVTPKSATLTEEQLANILSYGKTFDEIKVAMDSRFGTAFGKMGGLERTLKELQAGATSQEPIAVTVEDLAELKAEFPDLAQHIVTGLGRILAKQKRGVSAAPAPFDPTVVEPVVTEKFGQLNSVARQKEEIEELTENYPNWNEVIGAPGSTTEYRKWLLEQPAGYQTVVTNSWKANTIGRSLEKFHAHQEAQAGKKKKSAPTLSREEVLKEAIAQRGNPGHESGTTGDDDFNAGFNGKK